MSFESPDYEKLAGTVEAGQERNFSGAVFYLPLENVDTDRIIPAKYLSLNKKSEFGKHCLENVLTSLEERSRFNQSRILVAGENFASGSSREQAVYALEQAGIQCVIAPSFARIFETSMFANGLLCVTLSQEKIDQLFREKPIALEVDWENCQIKWGNERIAFPLSDNQKEKIRKGGSLGIMLEQAQELQKEGKI
ncbi:MAG: 3-isopropylmalate dehydratase small subunit [bacterium]|nr:3-isopropylmalate dehydratase small subunit [bacterium]